MKNKKLTPVILSVIAILLVSVLVLTACDPGSYNYDLADLRAPVKAIEVVNYDNPDQKSFISWVPDHSGKLKPLDMSAIQTVATLGTDRIDDFMQDLTEQHILYKYYAFDSPKSMCIRIIYEDDCFDIISCNANTFAGYIGTFTSEGKVENFIGCFSARQSFEYLLQTYFDI